MTLSFVFETASFTFSFHRQVYPSQFLPLFQQISLHAFNTPFLKYPHKFGTQTSTNLVTFSSYGFLIFESFSYYLSYQTYLAGYAIRLRCLVTLNSYTGYT